MLCYSSANIAEKKVFMNHLRWGSDEQQADTEEASSLCAQDPATSR